MTVKTKNIKRADDMSATTAGQIHPHSGYSGRARSQSAANHGCPDLRWPPAVRLLALVGCSALAWGAVILLSSLLFG
jgi:hypothetical protein